MITGSIDTGSIRALSNTRGYICIILNSIILVSPSYLEIIIKICTLFFWSVLYCQLWVYTHSTLLQAKEKCVRKPVPKCPSKLLEPVIGQSADWSSLQGHFGTELRAHFFCRMDYCWPWVYRYTYPFPLHGVQNETLILCISLAK